MRRSDLAALALLAAAGCSSASALPDGGRANLGEQLFEALRSGDHAALQQVLASDATFVTADGGQQGRAAVSAGLLELSTGSGAFEAHHEVARVTLPDGRLLFALGKNGQVQTVALFPGGAGGARSQALLDYQSAWNVADGAQRRALLSGAWDAEGQYVDPGSEAAGVAGLDQTIAAFQQNFPQGSLTGSTAVLLPDGWLEADWVLSVPGSPDLHGFDVGHLAASGKLDLIAGFFTPR
jgi:hypothetical protein